jgi:DNA invertase Pin-like site-specific DNA recombinase
MKAIIYLRVSTDEQNLGVDVQRANCLQYCQKHSIEIGGEYIDDGLSGGLAPEDREGLLKALDLLKKGDILLVHKRDRLARCNQAIALVEMAVSKKKARVISCADEGTWAADQNDPMAFMMRSMADTFSQFERLTIKQRTKSALAVKKSRNERTGHVPFGYKLAADGIHLEVCEEERDIIALMKELQSSGMTIRKIAAELNRRETFNRGDEWTKSATHRILQKAA